MDPQDFKNSPTGKLVPTEKNQLAFSPNFLPPQGLSLEPIMGKIARVQTVLGQLSGIGHRFKNVYMLLRPLQRKEAIASSGIEGAYTTLSDLLKNELKIQNTETSKSTIETQNYLKALNFATAHLEEENPISNRLFLKLHEILLEGVPTNRGSGVTPGEFKRNQNYITGSSQGEIRFIPPPPLNTPDLMSDLEKFINSRQMQDKYPSLILAALVHYQFETIHPFPDGNGRVGRMLIPLILKQNNVLTEPILFLSPVIENKKTAYVESLYNVSKDGSWIPWFEFFLDITEIACEKTISICAELLELEERYQKMIQAPRSSALQGDLIRALFEWPVITIPEMAKRLNVSYQVAQYNIKNLMETKIIQELDEEKPKVYFAGEIIDILERPW